MPPVPPRKQEDKVVLVGEQNPYGGDPYYALYPAPDGCSGHRLCNLILGMYRRDYMRVFDRVNLCSGDWSVREARESAKLLRGRKLVLCGSKVSQAFGVKFDPFFVCHEFGLVILPHPSGLCRIWNDAGSIQRARSAVAEFAPHLSDLLGKVDGRDDDSAEGN
jgi:hypothetical protein